MAIAMNADQRTGTTKGELRQLRLQGKIPGVIYGKQLTDAAQVMVDEQGAAGTASLSSECGA